MTCSPQDRSSCEIRTVVVGEIEGKSAKQRFAQCKKQNWKQNWKRKRKRKPHRKQESTSKLE